ncbi:MAG: thymidylate kinase [Acidobacteriaceae bacterium]|jgi:thymidylate kinase|nr:thymidylate kinase [Acidobacteriaceae bacterium]
MNTTTDQVSPRECLLVSFSGIDGAGKSTQITKLLTFLGEARLTVIQLAFWDNVVAFPSLRAGFSRKFLHSDGAVGSPEKPAHRNDKNTQKWYLTAARSALFLTDAINLRRVFYQARKQNADVIVFDRFIYDQIATLPLHQSWARAYANLLLKIAPKPDVAYLLDAIPEAALARKPEYPLDFLHKYRNTYLRLVKIAGLTLIDPVSPEEVHASIVRKLQLKSKRATVLRSSCDGMSSA